MDFFEVVLQKRQLFTVEIRKKKLNQLYSRSRRLNLQASLVDDDSINYNQNLTQNDIYTYLALIFEVINEREFQNRLINLNYLTLKAAEMDFFPKYCSEFQVTFLMPIYNLLKEYVSRINEFDESKKIIYIIWMFVNLSTDEETSQKLKCDLRILDQILPLLKVNQPQLLEKVFQLLNNLIADDDDFLLHLMYEEDFQKNLRIALTVKQNLEAMSDFIYLISFFIGKHQIVELYCFIFDCVIQIQQIDYMCVRDIVLSEQFSLKVCSYYAQMNIICSSPVTYQRLLLIMSNTKFTSVLDELNQHKLLKIMRKQFEQMDKEIFYQINGNMSWSYEFINDTKYLLKQLVKDFKQYDNARKAIIFYLISYIKNHQNDYFLDEFDIENLIQIGAVWLLVEALIFIKNDEQVLRMHVIECLIILMSDANAVFLVKKLDKEKHFTRDLNEKELKFIRQFL